MDVRFKKQKVLFANEEKKMRPIKSPIEVR